jgi:hypothetical protein
LSGIRAAEHDVAVGRAAGIDAKDSTIFQQNAVGISKGAWRHEAVAYVRFGRDEALTLATLPIVELVEVIVEAILSDYSGFPFSMCLRKIDSVSVETTMLVDILLSYRD